MTEPTVLIRYALTDPTEQQLALSNNALHVTSTTTYNERNHTNDPMYKRNTILHVATHHGRNLLENVMGSNAELNLDAQLMSPTHQLLIHLNAQHVISIKRAAQHKQPLPLTLRVPTREAIQSQDLTSLLQRYQLHAQQAAQITNEQHNLITLHAHYYGSNLTASARGITSFTQKPILLRIPDLNLRTWVPAAHHKPTTKHAQHNTPALTL